MNIQTGIKSNKMVTKSIDNKMLWDIIDGLRDEVNIAQDGITDLNDVVKDLQAEAIEQIKDNKRLNDKDGLYDEVKELQAENDGLAKLVVDLKAELDNLKGENIDLINHADFIEQGKIKKVIDGFKAEIKELNAELDTSNQLAEDLSVGGGIPIDANTTKHYPKEYKQEADEYFGHNPHCEKLFFFIVGGDEIDVDGDVTRTLNVGCDTIAEYDNV